VDDDVDDIVVVWVLVLDEMVLRPEDDIMLDTTDNEELF
jgi:hypothetical protein